MTCFVPQRQPRPPKVPCRDRSQRPSRPMALAHVAPRLGKATSSVALLLLRPSAVLLRLRVHSDQPVAWRLTGCEALADGPERCAAGEVQQVTYTLPKGVVSEETKGHLELEGFQAIPFAVAHSKASSRFKWLKNILKHLKTL